MGYNINDDVALGQLSSMFCDTTAVVTPPRGRIIIAITMMHDAQFETLVPEAITDTLTFKAPVDNGDGQGSAGAFGGTVATPVAEINSFGTTTPTLANAAIQSTAADGMVNSTNVFPKGLTIYGRWRGFNLAVADSKGGVIAYMGK